MILKVQYTVWCDSLCTVKKFMIHYKKAELYNYLPKKLCKCGINSYLAKPNTVWSRVSRYSHYWSIKHFVCLSFAIANLYCLIQSCVAFNKLLNDHSLTYTECDAIQS